MQNFFVECRDIDKDCKRNANEWMCHPLNSKLTGNFLTECSKSCLEGGFNHGQCEELSNNYLMNSFL